MIKCAIGGSKKRKKKPKRQPSGELRDPGPAGGKGGKGGGGSRSWEKQTAVEDGDVYIVAGAYGNLA